MFVIVKIIRLANTLNWQPFEANLSYLAEVTISRLHNRCLAITWLGLLPYLFDPMTVVLLPKLSAFSFELNERT